MSSETGKKSASNLSSSSVKSGQSINYQTSEYGHFFWASYFHQLNQPSYQQSMVNFSTQEEPENLTHPLTQGSHYSPISSSSSSPTPSSSSNMKDLCRYNPSNSFKNGKNPQTDNNGSKCRPNYGEWNSKDDRHINRYTANGVRSNQYSISENSDGDCPQKLDVDDDGENRYKKEMAAVIEQIQRRAAYQGYPIIHAKPAYKSPPREYTVVDEHRMDEIIAKELDLALSLSKKGRKNSRSHRQTKQKTRPKTGKKSSIKDKLISLTVERIKAAVFNCGPNPQSPHINKSNHEANQQSTQNQSFHQPEAWNQYQNYNTLGQFQHPQLMCQPKPEVMRQPADPQPLNRKPKRYCTCKKRDTRKNNDVPSSSISLSNHFNGPSANFNSTHPSAYELLHR